MARPDATTPKPTHERGKPGAKRTKATTREVADRVFQVSQLLAKKLHKHEIKKYLKSQHQLGARQAEEYITRAREYLIARSQRPKEQWVAEALNLYEAVVRDPEATHSEKMQATREVCTLLGLNAPTKIAPTTPDGENPYQPIDTSKLTTEELAVLHKAHIRLKNQPEAAD